VAEHYSKPAGYEDEGHEKNASIFHPPREESWLRDNEVAFVMKNNVVYGTNMKKIGTKSVKHKNYQDE
jgi:hypothetical protein